MMRSLRKSLSETSAPRPEPKFQTFFAQFSNSKSCVTPRSRVMASYSVRPRVSRRLALEGALPEEILHESTDVQANLCPKRLVVGLEHNPLQASVQALFEKEGHSPNGDIFPLGTTLLITLQRARSPHHGAVD